MGNENIIAAIFAPLATVIVILLGKVYDRKIASDKSHTDHQGTWEERLWKRVESLEENKDKILTEKNECMAKLMVLELEIKHLRDRIEDIESRESLFSPPV